MADYLLKPSYDSNKLPAGIKYVFRNVRLLGNEILTLNLVLFLMIDFYEEARLLFHPSSYLLMKTKGLGNVKWLPAKQSVRLRSALAGGVQD